jgi:hypothetical protein
VNVLSYLRWIFRLFTNRFGELIAVALFDLAMAGHGLGDSKWASAWSPAGSVWCLDLESVLLPDQNSDFDSLYDMRRENSGVNA